MTRHEYFGGMLRLVAARSTCSRRAVGAVVIDDAGHILSTGYNGVPSGFPHCTDTFCPGKLDGAGDFTRCEAIHAEVNALLQCSQIDRAHTIYVSVTPCFSCAKMIANTKIRRVVCLEPYADQQGQAILNRAGISVVFVGGAGTLTPPSSR